MQPSDIRRIHMQRPMEEEGRYNSMALDIGWKTYHAGGAPDIDLRVPRNAQDDFGRSECDRRDMFRKMSIDPTSYPNGVRQLVLCS